MNVAKHYRENGFYWHMAVPEIIKAKVETIMNIQWSWQICIAAWLILSVPVAIIVARIIGGVSQGDSIAIEEVDENYHQTDKT